VFFGINEGQEMGKMTSEEIRLRDEAMVSGRLVRPVSRQPQERKQAHYPDRVSQPKQTARHVGATPGAGAIRGLSIQRALEWAFGVEHARLEFNEIGETSGNLRQGIDGIWLMMQRGALGCQVDGGGSSAPAWDADVIASAVSSLPDSFGGRQMAVVVAEHARAGTVPDCMIGVRAKIRPCGTRVDRWGERSETEEAQHLGAGGWPVQVRRNRRGRVVEEPALYCPVMVTPTGAQIAAARQRYLDWWGALLWIGQELRTLRIMGGIEVTQDMPPMTPWITK